MCDTSPCGTVNYGHVCVTRLDKVTGGHLIPFTVVMHSRADSPSTGSSRTPPLTLTTPNPPDKVLGWHEVAKC